MEKVANIVFLGDSLSKKIFGDLKQTVEKRYCGRAEYNVKMEIGPSADYLTDFDKFFLHPFWDRSNVAVVCLGYDVVYKKEVPPEFYQVYEKVLLELDKRKIRTVLVTLKGRQEKKINRFILNMARRHEMRIANVDNYWDKNITWKKESISDEARRCIINAIIPVLIRTKMLVLWQFNGRYAHCNYACPYCYVATSVNKGMHFKYDIGTWENAFVRHFGLQDVVFYFSYGEPMMASHFYEVLEMIGRHPNWQVRMTSNMSLSLDKLMNTRVVKEGRMNINASFHPTQVSLDKFLERCETLRSHNIEPSVIYVMYPEQIDDFEEKYMPTFRAAGYRVHIRAFRGLYKAKKYPGAYTWEQWKKVARYMDTANFKYQLGEVCGLGRLSMLGVTHLLVDNEGKIEMCDSYVGDRHYGNLFDDRLLLDMEPKPFPGLVPLAAVDDIADYVELDYEDLVDNNVNDYNTQGGVIKLQDGSIQYPYEFVDFDKTDIKELCKVPRPAKAAWKFWLNPRWFFYHFIYSFIIKKYGKYIFAWFKGKYRLFKKGKLRLDNFWHS